MAGQCKVDVVRRDFCAAPKLGCLFMRNEPAIECPPCGDKPGFGIEIAQPDSGLHGPFGQCCQPVGIDIGVRRIHQHDVKWLQKRRIELAGVGAVQQGGHQRRERRVIDAHGPEDVGRKPRTGSITHGSAADHLRLVPERLESATDLIHHRAAGLVVAA